MTLRPGPESAGDTPCKAGAAWKKRWRAPAAHFARRAHYGLPSRTVFRVPAVVAVERSTGAGTVHFIVFEHVKLFVASTV